MIDRLKNVSGNRIRDPRGHGIEGREDEATVRTAEQIKDTGRQGGSEMNGQSTD